jgi:putative ABC transport system permease protein
VTEGAVGPFTAPIGFPASRVEEVRKTTGVRRADPVAIIGATAATPEPENVKVIGAVPGGVGPAADFKEQLRAPDAVIADASLGLDEGDPLALSGRRFTVAGVTHGHTYFAGVPTVVMSLTSAQALGFDGRPLATAIVAEGVSGDAPPGFSSLSTGDVKRDLNRPVASAKQTIDLIRRLLWLVSAGIIGAIVYLSALERTSDFAVLKAIGVSTSSLVRGLLGQTVVLALLAVGIAVLLELAIEPFSAMAPEVPVRGYVELAVAAVAAGILASLAALRRATRVDPALAFGG